MDDLIKDYRVELVEPGCAPGSGRWGALANLSHDISEVFPYFNAVLPDAQYDHENKILIWTEPGQHYALRSREIRVARVESLEQARDIIGRLVERVNQVWKERGSITPRFTERKLAPLLDIFRLLPKTNCRKCGYLTCMAYAADLRKGSAKLEWCSPLAQDRDSQNREKLLKLIMRD